MKYQVTYEAYFEADDALDAVAQAMEAINNDGANTLSAREY